MKEKNELGNQETRNKTKCSVGFHGFLNLKSEFDSRRGQVPNNKGLAASKKAHFRASKRLQKRALGVEFL